MEDPTFSDKIEEYLSELGRWLVFRLQIDLFLLVL